MPHQPERPKNNRDSFCLEHGIARRHTAHNRPQQNGVAERANRTIMEALTTMLSESHLPLVFWGEALATYGKTPFEMVHGKKPDVSHLRVWGCLAYVHVQRDKRDGFGSHMEKCVFIGYPDSYKAWKFYNPATRKVIISERADFDERFFPGTRHFDANTQSATPPPSSLFSLWDADVDPVPVLGGGEADAPPPAGHLEDAPTDQDHPVADLASPPPLAPIIVPPDALPPDVPDAPGEAEMEPIVEDAFLAEVERALFTSGAEKAEPSMYRQAMKRPDADEWQKAAEEEMEAHARNRT
ncbi:hypothetical protein HETIRDRAFT_454217 [Heterobasidion irregulare TC 32-1]|uniref:Retroviral polymerase SH3-like domain-containing protein n=1 Tax=Heterobasidion irregulare (strain TC 32-1) TaxID=747525 RepID=W4JXA9_HETIT|nr:uncharacterized protein HETIRDRAFT_454217 [Heterobasidion irregulare TC 32-1]ETW78197.1 hypothetical protein HETIRDRAFT_454217 [Heterobasidion irregulare TC 32-1]